MSDALLDRAVTCARSAGEAILGVFRSGLEVTRKDDGSPLTEADRLAHQRIVDGLRGTGIAIVSEEGSDLQLAAERYWLVDPLDGTREFLAGNGEFTVNIALIERGCPILGVVFAPALGELYAAVDGRAWFTIGETREECRRQGRAPRPRVLSSRFHDHPGVAQFASTNQLGETLAVGSALKFGRLARGAAEVYPRLAGSSEWDIAAGQAVLEAAGGSIVEWNSGVAIRHGKPNRRNPPFIAMRAPYEHRDFVVPPRLPEVA
jgi:3'(2'), 5'-bisphosphate nucleotidase